MIGAVSGVNFRGTTGTQATQDPFARPGRYAMPADNTPVDASTKKKKKGGFWKGLGITVLVAGLVATGLALGKGKLFKVLDPAVLQNAKFFPKMGHYLGVAGEAIAGTASKFWAKMPWVKKAAATVAP